MEVLHRQLSRYSIFEVESEAEALAMLNRANADMYESPPKLVEFNDDGFLMSRQPPEDGEEWAASGDLVEDEDETVHLTMFAKDHHVLTIELFDDMADMADPLHVDNIMLARHLERLSEASQKGQ